MGEAFVAVADDVDATFYNPGAMGLDPLSNSWKTFTLSKAEPFIELAGKEKLFFAELPVIWSATEKGLYKFDGNKWLNYEIYYLEQNDNIEKVVKKYLGLGDSPSEEKTLNEAVEAVRKLNGLKTKGEEEDLPDFKLPFAIALQGEIITALETDDAGKLWVGTRKGVFCYSGSKWKKYNDLDGLPDDHIRCISASAEEAWVGTDKGAAKFSGGKWRPFSTSGVC